MALTSKYKMAEAAYRIINGGAANSDAEIKIQDLINYVPMALADRIKIQYFEGRAEGMRFINGEFIFSFDDVTVSKDLDKDLYYSLMPASGVSLPHDMGTYQVSAMQDQSRPFIPVSNGFSAMHEGLPTQDLSGRIGYYIENDRMYFANMSVLNAIDQVLIKMVAPIGDIDDEEVINISKDVEGAVVNTLVERFGPATQAPQDTTNDNVG
jgi:hypothetical protein